MKFYNFIKVINNLSKGLKNEASRERMADGLRIIYECPIKDFDSKLWLRLAMPVWAKSVYEKHRFDIPPEEYVDHLRMAILETFECKGPGMKLKKTQRILLYSRDRDEEADYLQDFAERFWEYLDTILPKPS